MRNDGRQLTVKPLIGVLCCNEFLDRPVQTVATRFVEPLVRISGAAVLLVPAVAAAADILTIGDRLDGLLLTGSRSNVCPSRYGSGILDQQANDVQRDQVALALADHMIENGRPVFGICRGLQELNVLFGGTLREIEYGMHCHPDIDAGPFERLFEHRHDVALAPEGTLARASRRQRLSVNSVHRQGVDRLGSGLRIEAVSLGDQLIEAFSARPCGAPLLAVQWHPEWDTESCPTNRAIFSMIGSALRGEYFNP